MNQLKLPLLRIFTPVMGEAKANSALLSEFHVVVSTAVSSCCFYCCFMMLFLLLFHVVVSTAVSSCCGAVLLLQFLFKPTSETASVSLS